MGLVGVIIRFAHLIPLIGLMIPGEMALKKF